MSLLVFPAILLCFAGYVCFLNPTESKEGA